MEVSRKSFGVLGMVGWFMAALVAVGQAADGSEPDLPIVVPMSPDGVQRATVILDSYSYSPNHLVVENGKPVELTLTSVTMITPHNFIMKDSAGSLLVEQDVGAGRTVVARFVLTQPGLFPFFCDKRLWPIPSHRDKGMEGILEVK
ncbi:MAG: cupredoxin domain-containing protein [Nitrospira sp.]|nr:cupredoxin domain-containing protein [Nitrospira sp.]